MSTTSVFVAIAIVVIVAAYVVLLVQQLAVCFRDLRAQRAKRTRRRNASYI